MKKLLSIVISILMVSAMMSAVAFADAEQITLAGTMTGLVAGEAVTLTPTITVDGATTYTVEVNSQVFTVDGGTTVGSINSLSGITKVTPFTLVVNNSIPQTFTSDIRITTDNGVSQKFTISVADRILGDVDGDGEITSSDATDIMRSLIELSVSANYKAIAGIMSNEESEVSSSDATDIMRYLIELSYSNPNLGVAYLGGNAATEIVDPFTAVEPEPEPVKLSTPTNVYAYYQDGKLYYTFDAVANVSSYTITVGAETFTNVSATSGSLTLANTWDGTGTLAVTVTAIGDVTNYTNSDAANANAVYANVSGQLASWLSANGLSDVAITVYEITAAE